MVARLFLFVIACFLTTSGLYAQTIINGVNFESESIASTGQYYEAQNLYINSISIYKKESSKRLAELYKLTLFIPAEILESNTDQRLTLTPLLITKKDFKKGCISDLSSVSDRTKVYYYIEDVKSQLFGNPGGVSSFKVTGFTTVNDSSEGSISIANVVFNNEDLESSLQYDLEIELDTVLQAFVKKIRRALFIISHCKRSKQVLLSEKSNFSFKIEEEISFSTFSF